MGSAAESEGEEGEWMGRGRRRAPETFHILNPEKSSLEWDLNSRSKFDAGKIDSRSAKV